MSKILIKNGKIWDGERFFFADLFVEQGKIARLAEGIETDADFTYDATGQIVSAGLIDTHLHFRKMSSDGLGVGDWACFPFGVTAAVVLTPKCSNTQSVTETSPVFPKPFPARLKIHLQE